MYKNKPYTSCNFKPDYKDLDIENFDQDDKDIL